MTMQHVRDHYGVPAKRGARIKYQGYPGVITGTPRQVILSVNIRLDTGQRLTVHPTWGMEYLP